MSSPEIQPPTAGTADWKRAKQRFLFASLALILITVALFLHSSLSKPDVLNLGTERTTETLTQTESATTAAVGQAELAGDPQPTPEQKSEPEKPSEPKPERENAVSPSTTCDLTVGSWVPNPSREPQYTGESCRSLSRALNCQRNGRTNMHYLQYEWRSPECRIERFDASAFLERMRNKVFLVVGDSLTLNFFSALQCLIETVTPTKSREGPLFPGGPNAHALLAPHFNATFLRQAAAFLARSLPTGGDRTSSGSTWTVHLDQVHPEWAAVLPYTDYVVFGAGAWYTTGRVKTRHYMINNTEQPNNRMATMQAALHAVTRFTRSINYTGMPIFLTYSPMHGNVRVNSTAPSVGCSAYMDPVGADAVEVPQWNKDCIGVRNAQLEVVQQSKEFKVVDVTALSVLRPDGHLQDHCEHPKAIDCMHWCLPGIPDTWADIIYSHVMEFM